ncbi:MAG: glycerol dehydrogenase [Opitutales bacterium]|nr:glycerol dehydrogenase [Opitutales bacterium]
MLHKIQFPGKYIQDVNALSQLPSLVEACGGNGLVIASPSARRVLQERAETDAALGALPVDGFGGECCEKELSRLAVIIAEKRVGVLVGMGGGKVIDTAKIAADRAGIPVIIVPTIASTDAPCSGCAILYSELGVFESVYYQRANPAVVLVDLQIIADAPVRFLVAGMGDALSTWFEADSCRATRSMNACGGLGTMTGFALAKLCYDTLLRYGVAARVAAERHIVTPALEHIVEANILLSGLGFESGGLAAAHAIHNGLTALEPTHDYYHGEKVVIGVLAGLQLADVEPEIVDEVYTFCEDVGLPTTLEEIGLGDCDAAELMPAAVKACEQGSSIHHEAGEMTPEKVLNALLAADSIGTFRE